MITDSIFLEANFNGLVYFLLLILLGPPLLLAIIGLVLFRTTSRKAGKIFFILSGVYLVVGLGICGVLMLR